MVREDTRARIVAATLTTLKERGFAGTSTRAIARAGGFGQPLIFYYFDSLDELLIVATGGVEHGAPGARAARRGPDGALGRVGP